MPRSDSVYRGRFAPSPSGPLHMGSLITALASFLDARHRGGSWLVRMEDLDPPREEPGAAASILHSLQCHGLGWDETVMYQSNRGAAYGAALSALAQNGHLFACDCSRTLLQTDGVCRGQCRTRQSGISGPRSMRAAVAAGSGVQFTDLLQGPQHSTLGKSLRDFVVRRKDGLAAYQLAVVVDDAEQGITHVVRGSDLLDSTPRQIFLQQLLAYPTPRYCHLPVITTRQGQKFSKQARAPVLVNHDAIDNLRRALRFLNQDPPPDSLRTAARVLDYAIGQWTLERVPATMAIPAATIGLDT